MYTRKVMFELISHRAANMPDHAYKAAMKELKRLKKMPQQMPEHALIRYFILIIFLCLS